MWNWKPIAEAPKDGSDILLCIASGSSDKFYHVYWSQEDRWDEATQCMVTDEFWQETGAGERQRFTDAKLAGCYLLPMWCEIDPPPSSLSRDGIVYPGYVERRP
jgi:hypothetical protein